MKLVPQAVEQTDGMSDSETMQAIVDGAPTSKVSCGVAESQHREAPPAVGGEF